MSHDGKWRRTCGIRKSQECYNCANRVEILEDKNNITVTCDLGFGCRTLQFSRRVTPYCGAHRETSTEGATIDGNT